MGQTTTSSSMIGQLVEGYLLDGRYIQKLSRPIRILFALEDGAGAGPGTSGVPQSRHFSTRSLYSAILPCSRKNGQSGLGQCFTSFLRIRDDKEFQIGVHARFGGVSDNLLQRDFDVFAASDNRHLAIRCDELALGHEKAAGVSG